MTHSVILLAAAVVVPKGLRQEWLDEWRSELWYVRETCSHWKVFFFCLGAFRDALWLRHNCDGSDDSKPAWLESPMRCLLLLASLATIAVLLAFHLDGVRNTILPSPYQDSRNLVMISPDERSSTGSPRFSFAEFQSLKQRSADRFADLAFYTEGPVRIGRRRTIGCICHRQFVRTAERSVFFARRPADTDPERKSVE